MHIYLGTIERRVSAFDKKEAKKTKTEQKQNKRNARERQHDIRPEDTSSRHLWDILIVDNRYSSMNMRWTNFLKVQDDNIKLCWEKCVLELSLLFHIFNVFSQETVFV